MRHPDKQRFINAARHIEQSEIPLFEMEADAAIVNRMLGTDFPLSTRSYDLPVSDLVEWNRLMGNDMVYLSHIWRVGRREQTDDEGRIHYVDGMIKSPADLDKLWLPDLDEKRARLEEVLGAVEGTGMGLVVGEQDIYAIEQRWGAGLCLHGNIDIDGVLMSGSPEDVRRDVEEHIGRLGQGGGYIVASSHDLHHMLPVENIYAMRDAAHNTRFPVEQPAAGCEEHSSTS